MNGTVKKIIVFVVALCLTLCFVGCSAEAIANGEGANVNSLEKRDIKRGVYMAQTMFKDFVLDEDDVVYVRRNVPQLDGESDAADCWRYTGLVGMTVRLNELTDGKYLTELEKLLEAFKWYRGVRNDNNVGPGGTNREFKVFAVNRSTRGADRANAFGTLSVFDDQIWIAREYYNAYMLTGNREYLDIAIELVEYIYLVGYVPGLGGIYWGQGYQTRHSCSNGPLVKILVNLYKATDDERFKEWAYNIYDFMYNTLRDPSDNLYYDLVGTIYDFNGNPVANGNIDKTKYTYNAGAMISAGAAMYQLTGEQHYLDEAAATAESCYNKFGSHDFKEGYTMYPTATTTWFNLVMYIGYFDLFLCDNTKTEYLDDVQRTIDYAYDNFGTDGYIPVSWLLGWEYGYNKSDCKNLLDHSSHAETYLLLAQYQAAKNKAK